MKNEMKRLVLGFCIIAVIALIFVIVDKKENTQYKEASNLVIFGDNIDTQNTPFIEENGIYISTDTIGKVIDNYIFYDKVATKVIITTDTDVLKFKIDENKMSKNLENVNIDTPAKLVNGQPYIDINLVKDLYNIKVEYNEETNTISIDKKDTSDIPVLYNKVYVYSDISTKSNKLELLNRNNTVTVYTESLNHNRWYKVKTDSGIVGYIPKNNVDINMVSENNNDNSENENSQDNDVSVEQTKKLNMFWQYGSDLDTLGTSKIEGVDVVSPTWYELKNSNGDISSKFSQDYYNKAKSYGYEIWPIITNGIDSVSYTADDTSNMLNSEYNRENFIKNLINIVRTNKIDGINIDFEAMKTEDRDMYTQFIRELVPMLRKEGIKVSVDTYFVAYIDRAEIGKAVDYVVLMGYDQRGAWSTEAGSIAEISWVDKNINSLLNDSKIPASKIILGIPFYTRLWTIKDGEEKPTTKVYTMKNCQEFLDKYGIEAVYDENSGQNYAEYKTGSVTYKLWIEDATSIKNRVDIVNKYNLAGITGWRKGLETSDVWEIINDNLN